MARSIPSLIFHEYCEKVLTVKGKEEPCRGKVITVETVYEQHITIERICDHCGAQNRPIKKLKRRKR